jgi:hypothetical protein
VGGAGFAGASGTGGIGGGGGAPTASGAGGVGGGGGAPTAGAGGQASTKVSCSFQISGSISPDMATVGVVKWSTDLSGLTAARVEFSLDDPKDGEINVGSGGPIDPTQPSALLLGLKPDRSYTYRIVATAGQTYCVSDDQKIRTQPDPKAPALTVMAGDGFAARSNGFIVTCMGSDALIIDSDGAVVWWTVATSCSRAHMDWAGEYMWTMYGSAAPSNGGLVTRVRMDGSDPEQITGLERAHHDFAVLPGGIGTFVVWSADQSQQTSDLVERSPDGTLRKVATLDGATLSTSATLFHTNALRYYARDDSYTVSDLYAGISKLSRQGALQLQFVGSCIAALDLSRCASVQIPIGNHGHELLDNGNLLVISSFNLPSPINEYSFSLDQGVLTATLVWMYQSQVDNQHFGDVQRLANGNTLVTYSWYNTPDSNSALCTIQELTPTGTVVRGVTGDVGGYSTFRDTLYGPPQ